MGKRFNFDFIIISLIILLFISSCSSQKKEILVYAGKGLKYPIEEIKAKFEKKYRIKVNVIYSGSNIAFQAIKETMKGDICIPGYSCIIANDLVIESKFVAFHIPILAINKNSSRDINSFYDLAKPGIKIGIGNSEMCAIGNVAKEIIKKTKFSKEILKNIYIETPTAPKLLELLAKGEIDAAIIWEDMLKWPEAKNILGIDIPKNINEIQKINVILLSTTKNKKIALLFENYMTSYGKNIFKKYGFKVK